MAIKNIQISQVGVMGLMPQWVYIETDDTYAQVTASGYLSGAANEFVNSLRPNMMALVSTKTAKNIGVQPVLYLLQLSVSNNVWSLVPSPQASLLTTTVTIPTASVLTAYGTPYQLIPSPGAGQVVLLNKGILYTKFATTAFAGGGVGIVQYDSTVHGAGTNALSATIPAAEITASASQVYALTGNVGNVLTGITNKGIYFSNQTGVFTGGGASTLTFTLDYQIITATI